MQYQVLARRWRPQTFHELVGQEHVSRTLLNALQSGRVAHAFLLSGPRGSGKTTTARILAKALNCHTGKPGEPCGQCVACTEIAAGNCMDVLEIDAASNTGVDNVRELIDQARYHPARDRHKIFIIDEVHMLSNAAFNALLKTLEEPPQHVIFIMATTEYHKIPATILSRCQQYSFKLISYPLILERLRHIAKAENVQISNAALEQVVFSSGGSMRDAMSALDQVIAFSGDTVRDEDVTMLLGLVEPKILGDTVRAIAANDSDSLLKIVAGLVEVGQDLNNFCHRLLGQFRHLMVLKAGVSDPTVLGVPESLLPDLKQQTELFSREDLLRLFDAFLRVEADLKHATQVRFQLEMGLMETAQVARLRSLEGLIAEFKHFVEGEEGTGIKLPPTSTPARAAAPERDKDSHLRTASIGMAEAPDASSAAPENMSPNAASAEGSIPASQGSRDLLLRIAAAIGRESLESLLQELRCARLQGDSVILDSGDASEFSKRQVKENLPVISQAASRIVGRNVRVLLGERPASESAQQSPTTGAAPLDLSAGDVLEKAKREPVIKSFLDVFPGPVKAEKMDK
ncbi:MAG TPA: DNA polymerase III subunit gamma/tau [Acidobacteriota bacterium]|nr:DNA polymerase III subunit gamma/tau [Acidobacteriota bacterium]